jgi:hypothetical protein
MSDLVLFGGTGTGSQGLVHVRQMPTTEPTPQSTLTLFAPQHSECQEL